MNKNIFLFLKISILSILIISFPIYSQIQKDDQLQKISDLSLEALLSISVSGVSKYEQKLDKAPASVIVISRKMIEDRAYSDLSDLLKDIPGFDISENAGRFGENYSLRGIQGNDRFLVLIDGHKINPASGTFLSVGNSIALHFAKQVEIIYGPASAVYGADAFSGIINIVSNDFEADQMLLLQGEYGNEQQINGSILFHKEINPNLSFSAMIRGYMSDGPDFTKQGYTEYDSMIERYKKPHRANFEQPTNDHTIFIKSIYKNITLSYFRQYFNEGNSLAMSPAFYVFNKEARWIMSTDIVWGIYNKYFGDGSLISFDVSFIRHIQHPDSQFFKWKRVGHPGASFHQYMTGEDSTIKGVITYTKEFSEKLQIVAGTEYEHTGSVPPYANDEVLGNSFKYEGANAKTIKNELYLVENRIAGFAQLTYSFLKKFDIVLGGRFDSSSQYGDIFNHRLGLIFNPTKTTSIKLIYGSAFQAPSLFYQFEQFGIPPFVFRSTNEIKNSEDPNWKLENQMVDTFEIYFHQFFGKYVKMHLSLYRNNLYDLIERVMYDTTGSTWNKYFNMYTNGQRNENIGIQNIYGVNVTLNLALNDKVSGYIFYSYTDATADKKGEIVPIAKVSKHKVWLGLDLKEVLNYFCLSIRFKWIGDMNTALSNSLYKGDLQPGFKNLDITLSLKRLIKNISFYLCLENVFDSKIEHAGLFGQTGIYTPILPQSGFNFRLGFRYRY